MADRHSGGELLIIMTTAVVPSAIAVIAAYTGSIRMIGVRNDLDTGLRTEHRASVGAFAGGNAACVCPRISGLHGQCRGGTAGLPPRPWGARPFLQPQSPRRRRRVPPLRARLEPSDPAPAPAAADAPSGAPHASGATAGSGASLGAPASPSRSHASTTGNSAMLARPVVVGRWGWRGVVRRGGVISRCVKEGRRCARR